MAAPFRGSNWSFYAPVKKKTTTKKTGTAPPRPTGPPRPPDAEFMASIFPDWKERSDEEWAAILDPRVKPFEDANNKWRAQSLSQSEFVFEQAAAANKGLAVAFADMIRGGKPGTEGDAFAAQRFGNESMPLQILHMANQQLSKLTSDWQANEWEIASQYQKAMAEIPGVREKIRAEVEQGDMDEYTRNFNIANLILDEAWNVYEANAKQYNTDQQIELARIEAAKARNQAGYTNRKDAVSDASKFSAMDGNIWSVRRNKDGSYSAYDTGKKKPVKPGSKPKPAAKASGPTMEFNPDGSPNPNYKPPKATPKTKKENDLIEAEKDLGVRIQTDLRNEILGREEIEINPTTKQPYPDKRTYRVGGMDYGEALTYLTAIARNALKGRPLAYIDGWVRAQLRALFPERAAAEAKPGGG